MKKIIKIIGVLLTLAIMMLTSTAYAIEFVYDESQEQYITGDEAKQLDVVAQYYYDNYGFGIYYYYANQVNANLVDFSESYYVTYCNNDENGILLALTDDEYYFYCNGDAEEIFNDTDEMWNVFAVGETYYDSVAAYINYAGAEIVKYYYTTQPDSVTENLPVVDSYNNEVLENNTLKSDGSLVFDYYDLLTVDEESVLEAKLDELSSKHGMDIAVVIVDGLDGKTSEAFADDYYDYNDYGQNESNDGVVLMLSMADRDWHFSTTGKAIDVFSDEAQGYIFNNSVLAHFKNDDWFAGFNCYADECDRCLTAFENGEKFKPLLTPVDIAKKIGISAVIGFFVAFIFVKLVKKKHVTVKMKADAEDYLVPGSLRITQDLVTFAYKSLSSSKKVNVSSSSGGSSTHTSSSGTTHGGSGGKF